MRITSKVALVGGIPIVIAAAIAVAAWLLLSEAERARAGATLAGAAYRDLAAVAVAGNDYASAIAGERAQLSIRFAILADSAEATLDDLAAAVDSEERRADAIHVAGSLRNYREQMDGLVAITSRNDALIAEMGHRAEALIALADQARQRQHASNADIIASLAEADRDVRRARDIVDAAQEARAAFLAAEALRGQADPLDATAQRRLRFALARLRNAAADLEARLLEAERGEAAQAGATLFAAFDAAARGEAPAAALAAGAARVSGWIDDLIKIHATEQRALHEEMAQLLGYSVSAAETEQATQNVAIETLKLGRRTADALAARDVRAVAEILRESRALAEAMASLPISPLIQAEMIDAVEGWSARLATTGAGVAAQNSLLEEMSMTARAMLIGAQQLNDLLAEHAGRIGDTVRRILVLGAAIGLLLGAVAAYVVARSITEPLKRLREDMLVLARDPSAGVIAPPKAGWLRRDGRARDELHSMAQAVNVFVTEIGRREAQLRGAKDEVDAALDELRRTQADLIQAEKLASLGQLVAGVAHEINTPLGVALTTATTLEGEVDRLGASVESGRILRSDLTRSLSRLTEGARLVHVNLSRAADMVQSFKRVAADQTSEDRRRFVMDQWLRELLTSLGPALRKRGHEVETVCPPDLVLDTFPGALAQVFTNLIMNAVDHAFEEGRHGRISIVVLRTGASAIRVVFADDGRGIPPESAAKVFEPFFTTARERGNTGLGLHIVYNLVTAKLMGRIELDSRPREPGARGARFVIDLPVSPDRTGETFSVAAQ